MPTLVRGGVVLPMSGPRQVLDPGSVLIDGTGIVAVGDVATLDVDPRAAAAEVVDATGHAVIPGLHNCHLHSGLLRGTAESLALWDWLRTYVDPAHKALTPEIARVASLHCYAEGLLAGGDEVDHNRGHRQYRDAAAEAPLRHRHLVLDAGREVVGGRHRRDHRRRGRRHRLDG